MSKKRGGWAGPLVKFLVTKVGMKEAVMVGAFIAQWGMVARELGHEPTHDEYIAYWTESRATYFRDLKRLRRVWPGDKNPQRVWSWIEDQVPEDVDGDQSNVA